MACDEMHLLVQADVDGELAAGEAARVVAHMAGCPACAALHRRLRTLSSDVRALPRATAPASLRASILAAGRPGAAPARRPQRGAWWNWNGRLGAAFAAGMAAAVVGAVLLRGGDAAGDLAGEVVAGHVRALQPGHLIDVASGDRHAVKPWFDGRLDFAPSVPDLEAAGYPLTGGRLDYVGERPVAALAYQRRQHVVDVFVWPSADRRPGDSEGSRNGYNYVVRHAAGMAVWAVSDLGMAELREFAGLWVGR